MQHLPMDNHCQCIKPCNETLLNATSVTSSEGISIKNNTAIYRIPLRSVLSNTNLFETQIASKFQQI